MAIAIIVTFLSVGNFGKVLFMFLIFLLIGGSIGAFIAFRIPMTAMPELVAGFHSLVGLAAVFVAISAFLKPDAFNLRFVGNIKLASLIEMSLRCCNWSNYFFRFNNCFFKIKRNNVWSTYYF